MWALHLEPVDRTLLQRAVDPDVGLPVQPPQDLCVEVVGTESRRSGGSGSAALPCLGLGPVANPEAPVEANELRVLHRASRPSSMMTAFIWSNRSEDERRDSRHQHRHREIVVLMWAPRSERGAGPTEPELGEVQGPVESRTAVPAPLQAGAGLGAR